MRITIHKGESLYLKCPYAIVMKILETASSKIVCLGLLPIAKPNFKLFTASKNSFYTPEQWERGSECLAGGVMIGSNGIVMRKSVSVFSNCFHGVFDGFLKSIYFQRANKCRCDIRKTSQTCFPSSPTLRQALYQGCRNSLFI
jgi:hypothetical protein